MRFSLRLNNDLTVSQYVELAQQAESLDFDQFWVSNDLFLKSSPVILAKLATATERIQLGTCILNPYTLDPSEIAMMAATLDELGLLDSTLLVFMSDNGFQFGEHGLIDKRTMYEASIRVPLIVHCPDLFAGGRRPEMVLNIDVAPTLLEAGGARVPDTMHGRSFLGLLTGEASGWRDAFLYEYFWERAFPQTPTVLGVRGDRYKLMRFHGVWDRYELYDLETDPGEMRNLLGDIRLETQAGTIDRQIAQRADPEVAALFQRLSRRLDDLLAETGALDEHTWRGAAGR